MSLNTGLGTVDAEKDQSTMIDRIIIFIYDNWEEGKLGYLPRDCKS